MRIFRTRAEPRHFGFPRSTVVSMILLGVSTSVSAIPVTYDYVGPDFDAFSANFPASPPDGLTRVTASITFSMPLIDIPGLNTGNNLAGSVLSFSMSDGATTVTEATPGYDLFVSINGIDPDALALGAFSKWSMSVTRPEGDDFGGVGNWRISTFFDPGFSIVDKGSYCLTVAANGTCFNDSQAFVTGPPGGAWTRAADDGNGSMEVPEPGTLVLFSLGLIVFGLVRKRTNKKRASSPRLSA